jgi:hypothetical protein
MTWRAISDSPYPVAYAIRRYGAYSARVEAVKMLRYHLFVDSMPTEDIPPLTVEQINRMLGRGLHSSTLQLNLSALNEIGGARRGCVARVNGVVGGVQGV